MHNNFRKENVKINQVKPLSCIECGHTETEWIPYYEGNVLTYTLLICPRCGHKEPLKQKAFERIFEQWLKMKVSTREFELGLAKIINNKN